MWCEVMLKSGVRQAEAAVETLKSVPTRRFHLPIRISIVGRAKAAAGDIEERSRSSEPRSTRHRARARYGTNAETLRLKAEMLLALPRATDERSRTMPDGGDLWRAEAGCKVLGTQSRNGARRTLGATGATRRGPRPALRRFYGWFTEGFGNADVKAAAALLTELAIK